MEEIRVNTWNALQDALFKDAWIEEIGRFRSRFAFRGLSDARYPLTTTLTRLGRDYAVLEHHLQSNMTERVLFPGLEGLTVWLKRHYSQKHSPKQ